MTNPFWVFILLNWMACFYIQGIANKHGVSKSLGTLHKDIFNLSHAKRDSQKFKIEEIEEL